MLGTDYYKIIKNLTALPWHLSMCSLIFANPIKAREQFSHLITPMVSSAGFIIMNRVSTHTALWYVYQFTL